MSEKKALQLTDSGMLDYFFLKWSPYLFNLWGWYLGVGICRKPNWVSSIRIFNLSSFAQEPCLDQAFFVIVILLLVPVKSMSVS